MTGWHMEGPWLKNCNCDPGCPCDFNQRPTHGWCEGVVAMRIDKGYFGSVDLAGICWAAVVRWPGAMHEGNGEVQPIVDCRANGHQIAALAEAVSGRHGDRMMETIAAVCPTVHPPVIAQFEFDVDPNTRTGRLRVGDGILETEIEPLRGIDPPDPYRVVVKIPNGFEYTEAQVALAKRIRFKGALEIDLENSHSSLAYVRHGNTQTVAA